MLEKISMLANNTHQKYKQRFTACKLAIALLKHPDINDKTDLSHTQRLLREMENSIYVNTSNNSYSINGVLSSPQKLDPNISKIRDERDLLYKKLVESLYEKPTSCDNAYMRLMKFKKARKTFDPNEAVEMAMDTLKRYRYTPARMNYGSNSSDVPISVCGILLEKAYKDGKVAEKSKEMIAILNKNRNTNIARQLKSFANLYTVKAEEFPAAASKYCQLNAYQMQSKLVSEHNLFRQTLYVAGKRKGIELTDYVCKYLKKDRGNMSYSDIAIAAKSIHKASGFDKAEEFVERVATLYTTTPEKRKAYCKKHYTPNQGYSHGSPNYKIYSYYNFLSSLANGGNADFVRIVFDQIKHIPASHMERLNNISYRITNVLRGKDHQKSADLIVRMGVVGDPNELIFTPMFDRNQNALTFNSHILNYMKNDSTYKKNFIEALKKCPDSFGKKLIQAISENKISTVADAIAENFDAIKKLSDKKQGDLVSFIRETTGLMKGFDEKAEHAELNKWYTTIAKSTVSEEFQEFMTNPVSKIITNRIYDHTFHDMVGRIVMTVIHDPNKLDKLMVRAEQLYKKGIRMRSFQKLQGTYKDALIERLINNSSNRRSPVIIKFYVDMARNKGCSMRRINDYNVRRIFDEHIRQDRDSFKPGDNKKAFAGLVDFAGQIYGKGNASLGLAYSMNNYIYNYYIKPEQRAALLKTLEELKKDSQYPNIVDEMVIWMKASSANREKNKEKKNQLFKEITDYYLAVFNNDELSEAWRFAVYTQLYNYMRNVQEAQVITNRMMDLAIQYMQAPHGQFYPAYTASERFLDRYIKLKHTDEWKKKSNRYMELFFQQWTKMNKSNHHYGMNDRFMFKFLRFHFEANGAEKPDDIDRVLKMSKGNLWKMPETYAILVHYDQQERARKALVSNKHRWNVNSSKVILVSPEFVTKAAAFIDSFENPKDVLSAKFAMWLRNDDRKDNKHEKLKLKKTERITQLAKDYMEVMKSKEGQTSNTSPDTLLQSLLSHTHTYPILKEQVFKLSKGKDFLSLMAHDNYTLRNYYQALGKAYFTMSAQEGNAKPLVDTIAKMGDYSTSNNRYRYEVTSWVNQWTQVFRDKLQQNEDISEKYVAAIYEINHATFNAAVKLGRNYRNNLYLGHLVNDYRQTSMAVGKMDVFLKIVKGLSKNDKQEVNRYIRLDDIISIYRNSNIRKKVTPARFTKGVSDICASELFKAELKKKGIGEIESIYSYINRKIKVTDYLVKCLQGDKKFLKPIDQAYLYFLAEDPVNAVAACDKGIKEAKTDLEKASLIIDKATYCKATDPNTFEQCRKDIQPYKDKLDKRLVKKFQAAFPDSVSKKTVEN